MNTKKIISEVLIAIFFLLVAGGLLTLLIAANGNKKRNICRDYRVSIKSLQENNSQGCCSFIEEKEILKVIESATGGPVRDQPLSAFDLRRLEELLEKNVWIRDAELWFDNKDVLHISVKGREPLARIFTTAGNSFYIDKNGKQMPLSDKMSARVPVFTGFPGKKTGNRKDSLILDDIKNTAGFILANPFWMSQVAQVDIQSCGRKCWLFEMIPVFGNHVVKLGDGKQIDKKFNRLFEFYHQVLGKTGFDKYRMIDVQYKGQVIATKKGPDKTQPDSGRIKLNIAKLIHENLNWEGQDNEMQNQISFSQKTGKEILPGRDSTVRGIILKKDSIPPAPKKPVNEMKPNDEKLPKAVMPKKA